jgi:hypothetical protein
MRPGSKAHHSLPANITDGVPQGSVLGPLLFLIYINDLPKVVQNKTIPILFADDTSIVVTGSNPKDFHNSMTDALTCVQNWFRTNLLALNVNKTHRVQFKAKNKSTTDINIIHDNCPITTMSNIKFLGIYNK